MAIIKCDDVVEDVAEVVELTGSAATVEPYVEQDEVSLGKTLLAVESDFSTENASKTPLTRDAQAPFLTENRPSNISDQFRAEFGKFWVQDTDDEESGMVFLNSGLGNQQSQEDWEGVYAPNVFELEEVDAVEETPSTGSIGLSTYKQSYKATALESYWDFENNYVGASDVWTAYKLGTAAVQGSFSRPSPLVPDGQTFTDHAFRMNTPFSKKELEMFANIDGHVDVADVESDYDFFAKAYEEGIASTNVPENALPHLYSEVQKGESDEMNTDKLPEGYFRAWISNVLPDQTEMNKIAENYENVAILDSTVDERNDTTSAFEILMSYANRENLFPMNVNIEVNTNNISYLMSEAEDVGMVDDIVRFLMGDGDVTPSQPDSDTADGEAPDSTEDTPTPEVDLEGYTESDVKDALEEAFDSLESNEYRSWGDVLVPFGKLGRVMGTADSAVRTDFLTYYTELMNNEQDTDKKQNMVYVGEILLAYGDTLFNSPYWRTS